MIRTQAIEYSADGARMVGQIFYDDAAANAAPGILVAPEGDELGAFAKSRAEELARLGYVALAADLYGDGAAARDTAHALEWISSLTGDPPRLRARVGAAHAALKAFPGVDASRTAAIGYCFGGTAVLELARDGADLLGTVGFHCVLKMSAPENARHIKGRLLVMIGAEDPLVPAEQRHAFEAEMRQRGAAWELVVFGGAKHSFTNPGADHAEWAALAYDNSRTGDPGVRHYSFSRRFSAISETADYR